MTRKLSRREVLKRTAAASAATAIAPRALAQAPPTRYGNLGSAEARTLEAFVARLIPSDENGPGAVEAGAVRYIDRALGDALAGSREAYTNGLAALETYARKQTGRAFTALEPAAQDRIVADLEQDVATGFEPNAAAFFELVREHTLEGTFADPHYGGNEAFLGWELIGYPGIRLAVGPDEQRMDAKLEPSRVSAYDLPMFDDAD